MHKHNFWPAYKSNDYFACYFSVVIAIATQLINEN